MAYTVTEEDFEKNKSKLSREKAPAPLEQQRTLLRDSRKEIKELDKSRKKFAKDVLKNHKNTQRKPIKNRKKT